jgi:nicotinic acid mononucleotide adenylyltransferase
MTPSPKIRKERGPEAPLVFLIGSSSFATIDTWHRWTELLTSRTSRIAIRPTTRNGSPRGPGAFPKDAWPRITLNLREDAGRPAEARS